MGMFDELIVPCPYKGCDGIGIFQSKGGDCCLVTYDLDTAPWAVLMDCLEDVSRCEKCDQPFTIDLETEPKIVVKKYPRKEK